ncbi:hypothetical protein HDV03_000619 [Kappamyces sp. JEL0829]|nr:hypothetical protein HDV03_000619 [Kappamyces sp. JEL0829]
MSDTRAGRMMDSSRAEPKGMPQVATTALSMDQDHMLQSLVFEERLQLSRTRSLSSLSQETWSQELWPPETLSGAPPFSEDVFSQWKPKICSVCFAMDSAAWFNDRFAKDSWNCALCHKKVKRQSAPASLTNLAVSLPVRAARSMSTSSILSAPLQQRVESFGIDDVQPFVYHEPQAESRIPQPLPFEAVDAQLCTKPTCQSCAVPLTAPLSQLGANLYCASCLPKCSDDSDAEFNPDLDLEEPKPKAPLKRKSISLPSNTKDATLSHSNGRYCILCSATTSSCWYKDKQAQGEWNCSACYSKWRRKAISPPKDRECSKCFVTHTLIWYRDKKNKGLYHCKRCYDRAKKSK